MHTQLYYFFTNINQRSYPVYILSISYLYPIYTPSLIFGLSNAQLLRLGLELGLVGVELPESDGSVLAAADPDMT